MKQESIQNWEKNTIALWARLTGNFAMTEEEKEECLAVANDSKNDLIWAEYLRTKNSRKRFAFFGKKQERTRRELAVI